MEGEDQSGGDTERSHRVIHWTEYDDLSLNAGGIDWRKKDGQHVATSSTVQNETEIFRTPGLPSCGIEIIFTSKLP